MEVNNVIYTVKNEKANEILLEKRKEENICIVVLDGNEIEEIYQFVELLSSKLKFPSGSPYNIDGFLDWIRDLSWIAAAEYIVIINNYNHSFKGDEIKKQYVLELFKEYILPWWEDEVEQCVVGGRATPFNVYLVE